MEAYLEAKSKSKPKSNSKSNIAEQQYATANATARPNSQIDNDYDDDDVFDAFIPPSPITPRKSRKTSVNDTSPRKTPFGGNQEIDQTTVFYPQLNLTPTKSQSQSQSQSQPKPDSTHSPFFHPSTFVFSQSPEASKTPTPSRTSRSLPHYLSSFPSFSPPLSVINPSSSSPPPSSLTYIDEPLASQLPDAEPEAEPEPSQTPSQHHPQPPPPPPQSPITIDPCTETIREALTFLNKHSTSTSESENNMNENNNITLTLTNQDVSSFITLLERRIKGLVRSRDITRDALKRKDNDLKRRDGMICNQEGRICELEARIGELELQLEL